MPSRGGTAAAKSKPGTSHTAGSKRKSRGDTRGRAVEDDDDDEEDDDDDEYDDDDDSQVTASRRGTTTAGKSKSLFDPDKGGKTDDEGGNEGVKANDIWSKFVSDDQDVVRAPTAESGVSGATRSSQRTLGTGLTGSGSQGSQRPSQIDEEEEEEESSSDDDRTIYSDYYLPPEYQREVGTPGPRAEIVDSHEACSCFPNRSNKFLGAMLYDKITCKHTGLVGHTQPGVFKFNPYWNENMEEPRRMRKRDMKIAKTKFVFGYPKPKFELVSESEDEYDDEDETDEDEVESVKPPKTALKTPQRETSRAKTRDHDGDDDSGDDSDDDYDSEYDSDDEEYSEDEDFIPYQLPQIGYPKTPSLPPSSQSFRSRYSEYSESVADSLPSLPATRQNLTAQTKRTGVTQRTQRTQFTLPPSQRDTKTAKSNKTQKSAPKTAKKASSIDSGYDDDIGSRRSTLSRQSLPEGPVIGAARTFQGKFFDPVTNQVMLYDIGTRPGQRMFGGNLEPLNKPPTAISEARKQTPKKEGAGSKPGTKGSKRSTTSQQSHHSVPKAAVLGAVFISNLLSKNKAKKEALEAGYSDDEDNQ
ncbi:hypothetical protein ACF0H5_017082 [Mactra antiquata]